MDESEESDRYKVLNLLFELCPRTKYCVVTVFIASRPVEQLELRGFYNFIKLQDETKSDISRFPHSFLEGLSVTHLLTQATEYTVENAQGVFLWVRLVAAELLKYVGKGYSEELIFKYLRQLPRELEEFYELMLDKTKGVNDDLLAAVKMIQFVLFARRSLLEPLYYQIKRSTQRLRLMLIFVLPTLSPWTKYFLLLNMQIWLSLHDCTAIHSNRNWHAKLVTPPRLSLRYRLHWQSPSQSW